MIKQYKVVLNGVDISSYVSNIFVNVKEYINLNDKRKSIEDYKQEIVIYFSTIPEQIDIINLDKINLSLELNGKSIDTNLYTKEILFSLSN
ncbi:MAG: hypothetical protein N2505_06800 [Endomicrobia bacterium]|nr:hypothetical protein [Endomicrobiia bacterium]